MDNQINNTLNTSSQGNSLPKKVFNKKIIFLIFGVIIIGELIWALTVVLKPKTAPQVVNTPVVAQPEVEQPTTISLTTPNSEVKVGDKIQVLVNITSAKNTIASDIIINFDPKILSVETIGKDKSPMVLSGMYNEYPLNKLENGKIIVSGIATSLDGVLTNGLFGSVTFVAKASGESKISLDFSPTLTTDSNVVWANTKQDALMSVSDLEVNISP